MELGSSQIGYFGDSSYAWPRNRQDGLLEIELPVNGVPPAATRHNDLHRSNVLVGDIPPFGEHGIAPILKIIDFGRATELDLGETTGVQSNVHAIGRLMLSMITMSSRSIFSIPSDKHDVLVYNGQNIPTYAKGILPPFPGGPRPFPWLDEWLATLVALCMATDGNNRPNLQALSVWVPYSVRERTAEFYGIPTETNHAIQQLCETIIHNAPPPQMISGPR
ncbi:hypothetical protein F4677DRAFT_447377 [Hypoxylon crocopeplum]|nr:hypothetical protein F4677DRAFT_447377 [Hypoxylon crocopeplum]